MANAEIPTKPYLLRAIFEWCVDNGYTAHLAVKVDSRSQVPSEYVRNGEIVLNISPSAVHKLQMGNDLIEFSARFAGVARQISVPVAGVSAIYAKETKQGMSFEVDVAKPQVQTETEKEPSNNSGPSNEPGPAPLPVPMGVPAVTPTEPTKPSGGKPQLRRIK